MADAAVAMVERGYEVKVLTSARGYADPSVKYPSREVLDGVDVIRLPLSSLGKRTILHRVVGQLMFLLQAVIRGLFMPRLAGMVVSTSPPMASLAALLIHWLRGIPFTFWAMDLNPDQVLATGAMKPSSPAVKAMNWLNRRNLHAASAIIALDSFMAERLYAKLDVRDKTFVFPPWPMEDSLRIVPKQENPFVKEHGLENKRVIMYSGNHGVTTPVDPLVDAALELQDNEHLHFMFIGAGAGKQVVDEAIAKHHPRNLVSLPYQPLSEIGNSLSAADVHLVLMSEALIGIVHPCKVYGAMAVGKPILFLGPVPSHISEILELAPIGWQIPTGDPNAVREVLKEIDNTSDEQLADMGRQARALIDDRFSKAKLCDRFCEIVEGTLKQRVEATSTTTSTASS
ncbi:putative glycosyl transferase [Aeoliella mucimassa]|uniref:Putative glycosyl transferase n=2 Tax=Aeoliella mucimassa TaxID=2527972 RepID=A0A518AUV2_9BACT|nr:putative glycosyl transferase [Aeoliella mucimassa]